MKCEKREPNRYWDSQTEYFVGPTCRAFAARWGNSQITMGLFMHRPYITIAMFNRK